MQNNRSFPSGKMNGFVILSGCIILAICSCKKQYPSAELPKLTANNTTETGFVITPFGKMSKENVHLVEQGYQISMRNGHAFKVHSLSKAVMEDWGELHPHFNNHVKPLPRPYPAIDPTESGWITWAQWENFTGQPINQFTTNWTAPYFLPSSSDGELIFLFNGLENGDFIMQPVLQWGNNGAFGGNYWCIANWYAGPPGSQIGAYTTPITIASGTQLEGILTENNPEPDGSFSYTSAFANYANAMNISENQTYRNNGGSGSYTITPVAEPGLAVVTLEAQRVNTASDFPQQWGIAMTNMSLSTGAPGVINIVNNADWTAEVGSAASGSTVTMGENTQLLNNNSANVQANIFFSNNPLNPYMFANYSFGGWSGYNTSVNMNVGPGSPTFLSETGAIAAIPGYTVTVTVTGDMVKGGTNGTMTFTLAGATLSTGGSSITVTQSSRMATFVMPNSGYVTWSGSFSWTSNHSPEPIGGGAVSIK